MCGRQAYPDFVVNKYYPEGSGGVEIYLSKPEGYGLVCRRGLNLPQQKSNESIFQCKPITYDRKKL